MKKKVKWGCISSWPLQKDTYNCGVYCILYVKAIVKNLKDFKKSPPSFIIGDISLKDIALKRGSLLQFLKKLNRVMEEVNPLMKKVNRVTRKLLIVILLL